MNPYYLFMINGSLHGQHIIRCTQFLFKFNIKHTLSIQCCGTVNIIARWIKLLNSLRASTSMVPPGSSSYSIHPKAPMVIKFTSSLYYTGVSASSFISISSSISSSSVCMFVLVVPSCTAYSDSFIPFLCVSYSLLYLSSTFRLSSLSSLNFFPNSLHPQLRIPDQHRSSYFCRQTSTDLLPPSEIFYLGPSSRSPQFPLCAPLGDFPELTVGTS